MQLLTIFLDMEVQSYIVLSEIFNFEMWAVDNPIETVKNQHFPKIITLTIHFFEQTTLLLY